MSYISTSQSEAVRLVEAFRSTPEGLTLFLFVRPKAAKTAVGRLRRNDSSGKVELEVSLQAPPVDGAANDLLIRYLAKVLALPRTHLTLVAGQSSRHKAVRIRGRTEGEAAQALQAVLQPSKT